MNRKQIEQTPVGPALDALVAEAKGYHYWDFEGDYNGEYPMYSNLGSDKYIWVYMSEGDDEPGMPSCWSTDIAAAWELENEIAESNIRYRYEKHLERLLSMREDTLFDGMTGMVMRFCIAHASAEDRTRVWLLAQPGVE